jgi:F-type H+-transporting ATPase subunit b
MIATFLVTSSQLTDRAAGGVNLDFDATLFVQVGFILLLWVVLEPMLFQPMLKLFREREKRTEGAIKAARRIDEESAEAKSKYDDVMSQARAEATSLREKLRAESLRKESELLSKVRSETQKTLDVAREETKKDVDATRTSLQPHTRAIAKDLATRLLGREVS